MAFYFDGGGFRRADFDRFEKYWRVFERNTL
jgi:hypothetical protein